VSVFSYDFPLWERFFLPFRGAEKTFLTGYLSRFMETFLDMSRCEANEVSATRVKLVLSIRNGGRLNHKDTKTLNERHFAALFKKSSCAFVTSWLGGFYLVQGYSSFGHSRPRAGGTDKALDSFSFVDQFPIKGLQNKERLFPFTATRNQTFAIVEILDTWQRTSRRAKVS
jgi:hypothetical protein